MSFLDGIFIANAGPGNLTTNASSAAIIPSALSGNSFPGDIHVMIAYVTGADCTLATDLGDGWKILDAVYDAGTGFGALLAMMMSDRTNNRAGTLAGIGLPGNAAWTCRVSAISLRPSPSIGFWDIGAACGSKEGITATASSTTVNIPGVNPSGSQWLDVCGGGYNNGGTTTTIGTVVNTGGGLQNWLEIADVGQASPPHGIFLAIRATNQPPTQGCIGQPATTATLAVAKTNRAALRACIPISANVYGGAARRRLASGRRYG